MKNRECLLLYVGILFIATLFLSSPGLGQEPPKKTPELLNRGKKMYERACASCHGPKGDGEGPLSASLKTKPADFTKPLSQWPHTKGDPKKIFDTITNGISGTAMAKFRYPEEERWALVYAVKEFAKEKTESKGGGG